MGDPEDLFVVADGRRLAVRRLPAPVAADGDTAQPTLVFLHEGLGSIVQWRDFPAALCRRSGLPGLVYDRWGFGGSAPLELPRPPDYLSREAERSLPAVLEACGITQPLLVGHSDGGSIALLYAAAAPRSPAACVTLAAHVFVEEVSLDGIRAADQAWRDGDLRRRLERYHGAKTETMFRGWTETWLRPEFRDWSIVGRLSSISCPLLVIQGEDDEYGTPAQVETIVREAGGRAEPLMLPACGHQPHLQQREIVLEAAATFIRRVVDPLSRAGDG